MSSQHRWWLFSWNKAPIPVEGTDKEVILNMAAYVPDPNLVMPYLYNMRTESWYRWASIAEKWISENYGQLGAPCKKNAIELLLLKG